MKTQRIVGMAAVAMLGLSSVAAYAPDPLPENCRIVNAGDPDVAGDELEVCTERTYFECPASGVPVGNGQTYGWGTEAPGSFTEGNGCGSADPGALINTNTVDAWFSGEFTGRLESMNLHVSASDLPYNGVIGGWMVGVTVTVDGYVVADGTAEVFGVPVEGTEQMINDYVIGIDGIGFTGLGDDGTHYVDVVLSQYYSDTVAVLYMGASEVDSGIEFNPKKVAAARPAAA